MTYSHVRCVFGTQIRDVALTEFAATVYDYLPAPPGSAAWGDLTGTLSDQTDLQAELDAKADVSHTHVAADITDLPASITFDDIYPVGSVYFSVVNTPPSTGTWVRIAEGKFIVGQDPLDTDFDTGEETGGSKTYTPTGDVSQPTFTGDALANHQHGVGTIAANSHSGTAVSAHSGSAVGDHAAHTHSVTSNVAVGDHAAHTHSYTQVVNHVHTLATGTGSTGNFSQVIGTVDPSSGGTGGTPTQTALGTLSGNPTGGVASGTTGNPSATLSHSVTNNAVTSGNPSATLMHSVTQPDNHSVTQPSDHSMSGSTANASAGTPSGTVSQPTFTGDVLPNLPPYLVLFMWKRTA